MTLFHDRLRNRLKELSARALVLDSRVESGELADSMKAIEVHYCLVDLLTSCKDYSRAVQHAHRLLELLDFQVTADHPSVLSARCLAARTLLKIGEHQEALSLLDVVIEESQRSEDLELLAATKQHVLEHYLETGQAKMAWNIFVQNIELFERSELSGTAFFIHQIMTTALALGKTREYQLLSEWLAYVEDMEWEPDHATQQDNAARFDDYRAHAGGLQGLLGMSSSVPRGSSPHTGVIQAS